MKGEVDQAVRATKVAWLLESKRVNVTGEDISDERLKQLYLPLGRAGPRNAQSRGSRQPVRFGGTPKVHRHRLAEPYRCATGGLRRARPVRELWLLRRRINFG